MNTTTFTNTISFVSLVSFQILICSNINFLGYINPYPYILFILLFPLKNNRIFFIFLCFILGLIVDIFHDSGGIHAAACVFIAYMRPLVLKFSFGTMYDYQTIKFDATDFGARYAYISILVLLHHFILFSLEVFSLSEIILIIQKTLFSSIFTILLCIVLPIIFSKKNK